jgi:serine/threonine protein phosphatase PrpC
MTSVATKWTVESTWSGHLAMPPEVDAPSLPLVMQAHGATDRGRVRPSNQDQFLIAAPTAALWVLQSSCQKTGLQCADIGSHLLVVADGMGGRVGGGEASVLAIEAVETSVLSTLSWLLALRSSEQQPSVDVLTELRAALQQADTCVWQEAARHPELAGMGTTLTVAYRYRSSLFVAHAGDSRCYLLRAETLFRLTQDHTLASDLVRRGMLPSEEDARGGLRHIITNVVGGPREGVSVELHRLTLQAGDVILLCTDGLTRMLTDLQIASVLRAYPDPCRACERLVQGANEAGGHDNVTAIVARCEEMMRS